MNYHELLKELLGFIHDFEDNKISKQELIDATYHIHADVQALELESGVKS